MAGPPYKCKRMKIYIYEAALGTVTLGVVEGLVRELIKEGGVVPHYDSETGKHAIGTRHCTFTLTRWFKADNANTDLLYDMFNNETHFNLVGEIYEGAEVTGSKITLSDCIGYTYTPRTGGANDIVAEELRGEARDWFKD
jgi:hypothetical protein